MTILGIDIGGTNIKTALANESGEFLENFPVTYKTDKNIISLLKTILEKYSAYCDKIGISVAANVNKRGEIVNSTNLEIEKNFPLTEWAEKISQKPCRAINDGTASAVAILYRKEFTGFSNIVSLTMGTGIGGGIILNGKVLTTKTGIDSELGHITVIKDGKKCNCGNFGCLEAYCGEKAIVERFNKESHKKIPNTFELKKLLDNNNAIAEKTVKETGDYIGAALVTLTNILGIEAIAIGGGVAGLGETLTETISSYLRKNCFGSKLGIYPEVFVVENYQYLSLEGAVKLWHE